MQYLCLIYDDEKMMDAMPDAEKGAFFAEYMKFSADVKASGHMLAGDALQPVATATTLRVRDGKLTTTDGPFRRDPGAARRLLRDRGQGSGRGDPARRPHPQRALRLDRGASDHGVRRSVTRRRDPVRPRVGMLTA